MYDLLDDLLLSSPIEIGAVNSLINLYNKSIKRAKIKGKPNFRENSKLNINAGLSTDSDILIRNSIKLNRDRVMDFYLKSVAAQAFEERELLNTETEAVVFGNINFSNHTFKCGKCGEENTLNENPFRYYIDDKKKRIPLVVDNYCEHCDAFNTVDPFTFKEIIETIKGSSMFSYETLERSAMDLLVQDIEFPTTDGVVIDSTYIPDYDCWAKDYLDKVYSLENRGTLKEYLNITGLNVRDYAGSMGYIFNNLGSSIGEQVMSMDLKRLRDDAPPEAMYDFYREVEFEEIEVIDISGVGFLTEGDGVFPGTTKQATYAMLPYYVEYFIDYLNRVSPEKNKNLIEIFHSSENVKPAAVKFITSNTHTLSSKINEHLSDLRTLDLELPEKLMEYLGLKLPFDNIPECRDKFFALMSNHNPREYMLYLLILKAVVVEYPNRTFGELYSDILDDNLNSSRSMSLYSSYHPLLQDESNIEDLFSGRGDDIVRELALFENPELKGRL